MSDNGLHLPVQCQWISSGDNSLLRLMNRFYFRSNSNFGANKSTDVECVRVQRFCEVLQGSPVFAQVWTAEEAVLTRKTGLVVY